MNHHCSLITAIIVLYVDSSSASSSDSSNTGLIAGIAGGVVAVIVVIIVIIVCVVVCYKKKGTAMHLTDLLLMFSMSPDATDYKKETFQRYSGHSHIPMYI